MSEFRPCSSSVGRRRTWHQLSNNVHHRQDEYRTWQDWCEDLFDNWIQLCETDQLNFTKDTILAGADAFFQGVLDGIVHQLLQFLILLGTARLHSIFRCVWNGLNSFGLDLIMNLGPLGHMGLNSFDNYGFCQEIEISLLCGDLSKSVLWRLSHDAFRLNHLLLVFYELGIGGLTLLGLLDGGCSSRSLWSAAAESISTPAGSCGFAVSYNRDTFMVLCIRRSVWPNTVAKSHLVLLIGCRFLFFPFLFWKTSDCVDSSLV